MLIISLCVMLVQGTRKIPIQYAKESLEINSTAAFVILPLKVNAAGVMPIIFAQAIIMLPLSLCQLRKQPEALA